MKTPALLVLFCTSIALAGTAAAEPPAPSAAVGGLPPDRIVAIARSTGFDPIDRPVRRGEVYTLRALDPYDVAYRLVIDARTGRTVSLTEIAHAGPYEPVPPFAQILGRPNDGLAPPRPPRAVPHVAPAPHQTSAATAAPLPRPRPYVMDATSSILADPPKASASAEAQKAPEPAKSE